MSVSSSLKRITLDFTSTVEKKIHSTLYFTRTLVQCDGASWRVGIGGYDFDIFGFGMAWNGAFGWTA
jgi:hypothetical protein